MHFTFYFYDLPRVARNIVLCLDAGLKRTVYGDEHVKFWSVFSMIRPNCPEYDKFLEVTY